MNQFITRIGFLAFALPLALLPSHGQGAPTSEKPKAAYFRLVPNPTVAACLADDSGKPPTGEVKVLRGKLNDTLVLTLRHVKPGLAFDLFSVEHSNLKADGTPDPQFRGFGLAWYQSDVEVNSRGNAQVFIKTVLLDQIFGFDPAVLLGPTNTFHIGFWFNDPKDAEACGFDPSRPTPFNGEHKAGPLAMISLPDAETGLGPLCTDPNTATDPATCNP